MIHSSSHADHLKHLRVALTRIRKANMRLNLKKCIFASNSVQYLGHTVTASGIRPGKENTEAIAKASMPELQKKLRSFLGLANYFRSYIPGFAKLAAPLFRLTRKDSPWAEHTPLLATARMAFEAIKKAIVSEPCMAFPSCCLLYTSPSPRDKRQSRMPSSA